MMKLTCYGHKCLKDTVLGLCTNNREGGGIRNVYVAYSMVMLWGPSWLTQSPIIARIANFVIFLLVNFVHAIQR